LQQEEIEDASLNENLRPQGTTPLKKFNNRFKSSNARAVKPAKSGSPEITSMHDSSNIQSSAVKHIPEVELTLKIKFQNGLSPRNKGFIEN
jgi:hypothetical protein